MPDAAPRPRTSTRDLDTTRKALTDWLAERAGAAVTVSALDIPPANGMSSETLLFDATWDGRTHGLVARVAPDPANMPVFPRYDIGAQFRVIVDLHELGVIPLPNPRWCEEDAAVLGAPFFVMDRVEGVVPPDLMPYNFGDSWLFDASPEQQRQVQRTSIEVLAAVHGIDDADSRFAYLELPGRTEPTALRRHVANERAYYEWVCADHASPLIERGFEWLDAHWPADEGQTRLSWGDARIGNIMYRDFRPVAVLDWEMATLGPRELDVAWMLFLHRFFEDIAVIAGFPGMPGFMRREDVAATYEELTGHRPRDLDFYTLYAALRHAIIMTRIGRRAIHFGEAELPADVDDLITHRATLERMIEGAYWQ
ncbi:MAG TPA: phosphotransferase family protein [Acidimicrobiales bacterium]|jgi:aminoglycoside phosphotransferase (APT) family kinase protein|nr:phosphotransferase family protein [Acidimicrobiales bacterium]